MLLTTLERLLGPLCKPRSTGDTRVVRLQLNGVDTKIFSARWTVGLTFAA